MQRHIYWTYNMEAHHSKAHRGIDFESFINFLNTNQRQFDTNAQLN